MNKIKSNGCTSFPDGYWVECCIEHDKAYAKGGTWTERLTSDVYFGVCVWNKVINKTGQVWKADFLAAFMFFGVRIFGSPWCLPLYLWPHWRNHARWGFGKET